MNTAPLIRHRTVFIFLSLAGILVYLNSLNAPFHYDDLAYLKENPNIRSFEAFGNWISGGYAQVASRRPLLLFTFLVNYQLGGFDTFGYHLLNLLIHISNSFLLYLILYTLIEADNDKGYSPKCVLAALLFLLSPVNTESVTYLSSRSSELSFFFMLSSALCFIKATAHRLRPGYFVAGVFLFPLGLLTKESALVLPALLMLVDYFFLAKGPGRFRSRFRYHIPFFLILCLASAAWFSYAAEPTPSAARPWTTHILTELKVMKEYLRLLAIPVGLNIDHDVKPSSALDGSAAASLLMIFVLLMLSIYLRKKRPVISFSILWFFIALSPFFAVRLNDYMAERWVYAASAGFFVGLAEVLFLLKAYYRKAGMALIGAAVFMSGAMTVARNQVYASPVLLWEDAVKKSPDKFRPYMNLSYAYRENGNALLAVINAEESIKKSGKFIYLKAYINLAAAYEQRGEYDRALKALKSVEQYAEGNQVFYLNLGSLYLQAKNHAEALAAFKKALEISLNSPRVLFSIGSCYEQLHQGEKAREFYLLATKGVPRSGQEYLSQGISYFKLGDDRKALELFYEAVKADPLDVPVRFYLARTLYENGYLDAAYQHYSVIAGLSPCFTEAHKGMGLVMLDKGNAPSARKHFEQALRLLGPNASARKELLELSAKARE